MNNTQTKIDVAVDIKSKFVTVTSHNVWSRLYLSLCFLRYKNVTIGFLKVEEK